jgi:hypothetical protein
MARSTESQIKTFEEKIERTKKALMALGPMRPGSISMQYRHPAEKKGGFYQISYTHKMRSRTEFLQPQNLAQARKETANFRKFKQLMATWVDCSLELSKLRMKNVAAAAALKPRSAAAQKPKLAGGRKPKLASAPKSKLAGARATPKGRAGR